ncbi:MAG: hypothetical protein ABR990_08580 [Terracidiphilus sp.]|jgi:hypothetical protein
MNKISPFLLGLSLAVAGSSVAVAQDQSTASVSTPKYLQIIVEYTKPGKGGLAHDKTESAFVQAVTKANFPINYIAFNAMSGKPRAIYLSHFDSFEALEKAMKIFEGPAAADFEKLNVADGELLEDSKSLYFSFVPELSYHTRTDISHGHFLEARILHVRPGHGKEFNELVKMWIAAEDKVGGADHWGAYRIEYGEQLGSYVFLTSDNSLADIDQSNALESKFNAALSESDKVRLRELREAAIDTDRFELYSVNPAQSYVPDAFTKADPEFWKPKAAEAPATEPKKHKP